MESKPPLTHTRRQVEVTIPPYAGLTDLLRQFGEMQAELRNESPRGCVLVAAAVIDRGLETLIRAFLIDDERCADRLLGEAGGGGSSERPLGSFSSRIKAVEALGLLSADDCADLDLIRRIRNDCAHDPEAFAFAGSSEDRCREFRLNKAVYGKDWTRTQPARNAFEWVASMHVLNIVSATAHASATRRTRPVGDSQFIAALKAAKVETVAPEDAEPGKS